MKLPEQGSLFVGEERTMLLPHLAESQLFPEEKFSDTQPPNVEHGNHYHQWVEACLGMRRRAQGSATRVR